MDIPRVPTRQCARGAAHPSRRLRSAVMGFQVRPRGRLALLSRSAVSAVVLIGAVLWSSGASVQWQGRQYRIGVLNASFTAASPTVRGLREGIKAEGLEEGRDVRFDVRSTDGDETRVTPSWPPS